MALHLQVVASTEHTDSHQRGQQQQVQPPSCPGAESQDDEQQESPLREADCPICYNNCIGHVPAEANEAAGEMQLGGQDRTRAAEQVNQMLLCKSVAQREWHDLTVCSC